MYRLELHAIETSLQGVQRAFPTINDLLHSRRDSMTDEVVENMLVGYTFIDKALGDGTDLLAPRHLTGLRELNISTWLTNRGWRSPMNVRPCTRGWTFSIFHAWSDACGVVSCASR